MNFAETNALPNDIVLHAFHRERVHRAWRDDLQDPEPLDPFALEYFRWSFVKGRSSLGQCDSKALLAELRTLAKDLTKTVSESLVYFLTDCGLLTNIEVNILMRTAGKTDRNRERQRRRKNAYRRVLSHLNALGLLRD